MLATPPNTSAGVRNSLELSINGSNALSHARHLNHSPPAAYSLARQLFPSLQLPPPFAGDTSRRLADQFQQTCTFFFFFLPLPLSLLLRHHFKTASCLVSQKSSAPGPPRPRWPLIRRSRANAFKNMHRHLRPCIRVIIIMTL